LGIEESDQCKDNVSSIESTSSAAKVGWKNCFFLGLGWVDNM
jgi:hypothetical protein